MIKFSLLLASVSAFCVVAASSEALSLGQIDNFQDGTTMGWTNGGQIAPPGNVGNGQGGANDRYLQVTAVGGGGPGSRLTTFNFSQWTGNYIAAGVTTLEIDLLNQSAVQLSIRFAFWSDQFFNGAPGYLTQAMILPPGSGWHHFSISITEANVIAVDKNPTDYSTFFSNIGELRIINEAGTSNLIGDPVVGMLGIDNITAVPEPTTLALGAMGLIYLGSRVLRRKQRTRIVAAV